MIDFNSMKKNKGSSLQALTEKLEKLNGKGGGNNRDERKFYPGFDKKEGKGYAVVRFLPNKEGETLVKVISHNFKGVGGWYNERSRATIGEEDPVGISNGLYWKAGEEQGNEGLKNIARKRKRSTKYFANVYVIKDSINPENNGKVMIYEFGPQIFKKIEAMVKPSTEDDKPVDVFDMWSGADFRIKISGKEIPDSKNEGGKVVVPNYEDSLFAVPSEFMDGDEDAMKEQYEKTYSLAEFTSVKEFDELAQRFKKVTGEEYNALEKGKDASSAHAERIDQEIKQSQERQEPTPEPEAESESYQEDEPIAEEDPMEAFRRLANGG